MVKEAKYQLTKKLDKVEIRLYNSLIIAKVDGYGDSGFDFLFNYISGNNISKTSIDMTSPVISRNIEMTAPVLSEEDSIAFVLPVSGVSIAPALPGRTNASINASTKNNRTSNIGSLFITSLLF